MTINCHIKAHYFFLHVKGFILIHSFFIQISSWNHPNPPLLTNLDQLTLLQVRALHPRLPTTRSHSVITDYTKMNSVSKEYEGDSMFSTSPKGLVDVDSTTSGLIITKDPFTPDNDRQSNSQIYSYYTTNSADNTYSLANAAPQCHSTTPKYMILLATIPGFVLISAIIVMVIKVLSRKVHKRRRRTGTLRGTSRRPIVRDLGSLQMSCVVNEGNVEGIEMQER